jgi:hypothetical protein
MNAVTLELLSRAYYRDIESTEILSKTQHDGITFLRDNHLIDVNVGLGTISIAERGVAHVEYILALPFPVQVTTWVHKLS